MKSIKVYFGRKAHGHMRKKHMKGEGMGSLLLSQGGSGGASAYESVADYERQTGVMVGRGIGRGSLEKIAPKLDNLKISSLKRVKPKNIAFNFK